MSWRPWMSWRNDRQEKTPKSDINPDGNPLVEEDAGPAFLSAPTPHAASGPHALKPTSTSSSGGTAASSTKLLVAGPNFSTVGADNGGYHMIPPDNASAVGPNNVVVAVNGVIEWYDKSGNLQSNQSLNQFFSSLSPLSNFSDPNQSPSFDPRVAYDTTSNRFVVVADEGSDAGGSDTNTSNLLVAVSNDSNPNDGWIFAKINSDLVVNGADSWADFPQIATDGQAIYITANMFSHSGGTYEGSRLWILNESDFALPSGQTIPSSATVSPTVNVYDPSTAAGLTSDLFSLAPAQVYGTFSDSSGDGTFLVAYNGDTLAGGTGKALDVIRVDNALSSPTFTYQQLGVGNIDSAGQDATFTAPQRGTSKTIDAGDDRVLSAVWRNGSLYATADVIPPSGADAGHVTAHWFQITTADPSLSASAGLSLASQGDVSGSAIGSGVRTYYPSIAVDSAGDFVVNVSASGPSLYAGAYYAIHSSTDAAGTVEKPIAFAKGVASYARTFGGGDNRWGDFSSISPDPSNSQGFWAFNEYAWTQGTRIQGERGRWATEIADISVGSGTASPVVASSTTQSSTSDTGGSSLGTGNLAHDEVRKLLLGDSTEADVATGSPADNVFLLQAGASDFGYGSPTSGASFGLSDHLHGHFDSVDSSLHHLPHHWLQNDLIPS